MWSVGIALPANVTACLALAWPWSASTHTTTAMAIGLVVGNAGLAWVMRHRMVGQSVLAYAANERTGQDGAHWLLARSLTGYATHAALSTAAVLLPASALTIANLSSKVVAAVTTTFTNA